MDRRDFLKVTGLAAAAPALVALTAPQDAHAQALSPVIDPVAAPSPVSIAPLRIGSPGTYRVFGTVTLEAPVVQISGLEHDQSISWSSGATSTPMTASFTSIEQIDSLAEAPAVRVTGGQIQALSVVPVDLI
ncbi:MAG: twin-arginine translocation signal domain-containing protein [Chloroflexota bacterium]